MKRYDKLIFVSASDTCRGPMAQAIMKSKFLMGPLSIESRGLVVLFPEPINQKAEAVLISNGLSMKDYQSKGLSETDFSETCLILTMETQQKNKILEEYENAVNVYTFAEYLKFEGAIKEPVGGALVDYGECYEVLEILVKRLVILLNEEEIT
jgi:protein-tyrosine-phosphatase